MRKMVNLRVRAKAKEARVDVDPVLMLRKSTKRRITGNAQRLRMTYLRPGRSKTLTNAGSIIRQEHATLVLNVDLTMMNQDAQAVDRILHSSRRQTKPRSSRRVLCG